MKNLFLLLLFPSVIFSQSKNLNDTIHWQETKPLSWEDFKGKEKKGMSGEAFCLLQANYEKPNPLKKTKFKIAAVWDKKKSWIAPASKTADELLYYQVLFDIYEVHARKLRKEFSETKFGLNPEAEFREKYNTEAENITEETNDYRDETGEGVVMIAVKKWNDKIKEELKLLDNFKE
ncbi:MAG: hypothetical protein HY841_09910 [Bacteroidetes bacterium]|nr:hypothetical protein [Bacteroidota bacterium]